MKRGLDEDAQGERLHLIIENRVASRPAEVDKMKCNAFVQFSASNEIHQGSAANSLQSREDYTTKLCKDQNEIQVNWIIQIHFETEFQQTRLPHVTVNPSVSRSSSESLRRKKRPDAMSRAESPHDTIRRLTVAVQGPEERGVGVVRPPAQAAVEVARAVGWRRGSCCGGGEE